AALCLRTYEKGADRSISCVKFRHSQFHPRLLTLIERLLILALTRRGNSADLQALCAFLHLGDEVEPPRVLCIRRREAARMANSEALPGPANMSSVRTNTET